MNGRINVVEATTSTDVSVESVNAIDGAYEAGEDLRVLATLKNNGAESSGMFNVNFYASTDAIIRKPCRSGTSLVNRGGSDYR